MIQKEPKKFRKGQFLFIISFVLVYFFVFLVSAAPPQLENANPNLPSLDGAVTSNNTFIFNQTNVNITNNINQFDQSLNTTDSVTFVNITSDNLLPSSNNTGSVGLEQQRWANGFFQNLNVTNLGGLSPINLVSDMIGSGFNITADNFFGNFNASLLENPPWLNITGGSLTGDLNMTGNDILNVEIGFFNFLGSLTNRIIQIFATDVDISNDLSVGGNLDVNGNANVISIDFNLTPTTTSCQEGRIFWSDDDKTLNVCPDIMDVTLQVGQELHLRVTNKAGKTLPNGAVVFIDGVQGQRPTVDCAISSNSTKARLVGMITHECLDNTNCIVTTYGKVRELDTSMFSVGAAVYMSPTEECNITNVIPTAPNFPVSVGKVITSSSTTGQVLVQLGPIDVIDAMVTDSLTAINNITASFFIGDGSLLTGIIGGLWTNSSGNATYVDGNVGIGTTSPTQALDVVGSITSSEDTIMSNDKFIRTGTSDAADNESTGIAGGGSLSSIRGSFVRVSGNEDGNTGKLFLTAGNVVGGFIRLSTGGSTRLDVSDVGDFDFQAGDLLTTGDFSFQGAGPHSIGGVVDTKNQLTLTGTYTPSSGTASAFFMDTTIPSQVGATTIGMRLKTSITEAASGTHANFNTLQVHAPTITLGNAALTIASTIRIVAAPTEGDNNYALLVDSGDARFDGKVSIGVASPQKDFHISSTVPTIRLSDSDAGTDQAVATLIELFRSDDTNRIGFWGMGSSSTDIMELATDYTAGEIAFSTGSNVEAVRIDSSGNFGIGTMSPQNLLNVIGDANFTGNLTLGQQITFAFGEIIDNIVDGWIRITGNLNVTGDLEVGGNVDVTGNITVDTIIDNTIFAQLSSFVNQEPTNTTPVVITYNTQDAINGLTHSISVNPGEITIDTGGTYFVSPQPQVSKDMGGAKVDFDMFLQVDRNGTFLNEPNSNIKLTIKDSDITDVIVSAFTIKLNAGEKIRIMQRVSDSSVGMGLKNTNATADVPRTPSIIFTMYRVGGDQ